MVAHSQKETIVTEKPDRPDLIVLVRHGESERNRVKGNNVYLPDTDAGRSLRGVADHHIALTDFGHRQSKETGRALRERFGVFDVLYDSGYRRTVDTRDGLVTAYTDDERAAMKLRTDYGLRERDGGYTHGMTTEEVDQHFPWFKEHWDRVGYFYTRPPGGESQAEVAERIFRFNGTMFRHRAGQHVLIVAHGGSIRAIRFHLERWTPDEYEEDVKKGTCKNCGVTVYERDPATNQLCLIEYNTVFWKE